MGSSTADGLDSVGSVSRHEARQVAHPRIAQVFSLDPACSFAKPCGVEFADPLARIRLAFDEGRYEEARAALLQVLHQSPNNPAVLRSLSVVSTRLDDPAQAFRYAQQAVTAAPQDSEAHFSQALLNLLHGNYEKGFIEYEWRLLRPNCLVPRYAQGQRWDGRALGAEQALLLHGEQGFGDNLQFIRFLPLLRERVKTIYLACHPELVRLFSRLDGLAGIVTDRQPLPPCEFHCPLLSLPRLFQITLPTLPKAVPYLPLSPSSPLAHAPRPRVGLVWRTNRAAANWAQRSIPLAALKPLAALPLDWISLQRDVDADEHALLRDVFRAEERGPGLRDFQDTADFIQTLHLLITVDTSIAHLAGALARPAWVVLPRWADWRWLLDRPDSPWYPTLTLLRQKTEGDWSHVVQTLHAKLSQLAAER